MRDDRRSTQKKRVIIGWIVLLVIILTGYIPPIHDAFLPMAKDISLIDFWVNHKFSYLVIIFALYTVYELKTNRDWFHRIRVYQEGIGIINDKTKEEYFAPKESLQFSVNRLGESISIVAKEFPGNHRAILYFHDNKCLTDGSELIDNLEAHYPVKYKT
ncbi:hypothetical protein ACSZOP_03150 [Colibacter massiliensis]|uniref:hypothetical protein n=1 Tax=Colibacter massiliensis TaxID=1852379 RepID=UPI003F8E738F